MLLNKLKLALVATLTIGSVGLGAGSLTQRVLAEKPAAQAGKEKPAGQKGKAATSEVRGVVRSVDVGQRTLTVVAKLGPQTFAVAKEARVLLDDGTGGKLGFKEGKLADLLEGTAVVVRLAPDQQEVVAIWAEGPSLTGLVKAVDAATNTLTLTITPRKNEPIQDKTYDVAKEVKVLIADGKARDKGKAEEQTLAHVPVGAIVTVKLSADQKVVRSIQAEGPELHGVVKAVENGTITLAVSVQKGQPPVDKRFAVSPNASVVIGDGKGTKVPVPESKLADVPVGAVVSLKLAADQQTVIRLRAEAPSYTGILKAVDAAKNTMTLTVTTRKGQEGEDRTFEVAKDVSVKIDGEEGKFSDLPTEALVSVRLSANQKVVVRIQTEGRNTYGTVKAVDASSHRITIGNKQGEHTLAVAKEAAIFIDGQGSKLADVPAEAFVNIKLSADQKTVLRLWAEGPSVQGILKAVDADKNTITVTVPVRKGESEDKVFEVAKDAKVVTAIYGVPLKLADLKGEKKVVLSLSTNQKAVKRITLVKE
jgi:small nuclear ribonucleoprotein (snRNP)-like protein